MRRMTNGAWFVWIAALIGLVVLLATGHPGWAGFIALPTVVAIYLLNKRSMA
jgi:hypothetical protein